MEENYGPFQGGTRNMSHRGGRPNTRPPFNSFNTHRGRGDFYHQGMPAMHQGFAPTAGYPPTFSQTSETHFTQNLVGGRGFRRPSMNRSHNLRGPQRGTDLSGRMAPSFELNYPVMPHFPRGIQMQSPPSMPAGVPAGVPAGNGMQLCMPADIPPGVSTGMPAYAPSGPPGTQQWSYPNQHLVVEHHNRHFIPPVYHQISPLPQEYTIPPQEYTIPPQEYTISPQEYTIPPQEYNIPQQEYTIPMQEYTAPPPITQCCDPQTAYNIIYYDPRQGYFTSGAHNLVPEVIDSPYSTLNVNAPSYNDTSVGVNDAELPTPNEAFESSDNHTVFKSEEQEMSNTPDNKCSMQCTWKNDSFVNETFQNERLHQDWKHEPENQFCDLHYAKPIIKVNQLNSLVKESNENLKSSVSTGSRNAKGRIKVENDVQSTKKRVAKELNNMTENELLSPHVEQPQNKEKIRSQLEKKQSPIKDDDHCDGSVLQPQNQREEVIDFVQLNKLAEEHRQAELAKLTPIVKDVYCEDRRVAAMSQQEVQEFRAKKHEITVSYVSQQELSVLTRAVETTDVQPQIPIPNPVPTFEDCFRNYPEILQQIANQGFTEPSPIQCQLWPCIMRGLDVVGIAQTGSGKTLAFLLPALIHIERQHKPKDQRNSPTVLILAPTRELAQQIDKEVNKYSYKNIRSVCLYGGGNRQEQIEAVAVQTEIIIATPGRLNDLVQANKLNLKEVSMLILDEADEMLDQGFEPQINKALLRVRGDRQTILTSATWPASVRRMAQNYTRNPALVVVGTVDLRAVTTVKQNIVFIEEDDKFNWLVNFLQNMAPTDKAIVFVGKKAVADHISSELALMRITAQCIHGSLSQPDREQAIEDMQNGMANILIATDVAARGIDIENITHIINHDFPRCVEQYVHRIGRTGRAGKKGESHTFISRRDWSSAQQLIEILQHAKQEVPDELLDMAERFKNRRVGDRGRGNRGGRGGWVDRRGEGAGFSSSSSDFGERRDFRQYDGERRGRGGFGGGNHSHGSRFQN